MRKYKAKAIHADLGAFPYILAYSSIGTLGNYSGIFRTLCNPGTFRTRGIFRALAYLKPEAYSQPYQLLLI